MTCAWFIGFGTSHSDTRAMRDAVLEGFKLISDHLGFLEANISKSGQNNKTQDSILSCLLASSHFSNVCLQIMYQLAYLVMPLPQGFF